MLLVPNGIGVGLEVDRCTDGLHPFKNRHNAAFVPTAFVFRCSIGSVLSLTLFVSGRFEDLLTFKLCSDLARPSSLHTEVKDFLDHLCRFLVNDPLLWIVGILDVYKRQQMLQLQSEEAIRVHKEAAGTMREANWGVRPLILQNF